MSTASLTNNPTTLDPGTAQSVWVRNDGATYVTVTNGSQVTKVRPGRDLNLVIEDSGAVTAFVDIPDGSSGTLHYEVVGGGTDPITRDELTVAVAAEADARDAAIAVQAGTDATAYAPRLSPGTVATTATAAVANKVNRYDATSGALAPAAPTVGTAGSWYEVQKTDTSANAVTHGGEALSGQGDVCRWISDGSSWVSGGVRTTRANQSGTYVPIMKRRTSGACDTIILGDSIDAASGNGWWDQLCTASSQRMSRLRNSGISGNTTTQMLARIQADVIQHAPRVCVLGGPANDHGGASGISVATTKANYQAMVDALRAAGIEVVIRNASPAEDGTNGQTLAERLTLIENHNAWLETWGRAQGIPVLDIWTPLVDPADGTYLTGLNADGIHPNMAGVTAIVAYLLPRLPTVFDGAVRLPGRIGQTDNLLDADTYHPYGLIVDSNSNGKADGWSVYDTSGATAIWTVTPAVAPAKGNWQRVVTSAGQTQIYTAQTTVIGHTYEVLVRIKTISTGAYMLTAPIGGPNNGSTIVEGTAVDGIFRAVFTASAMSSIIKIGQYNATSLPSDWQAAQVIVRDIS